MSDQFNKSRAAVRSAVPELADPEAEPMEEGRVSAIRQLRRPKIGSVCVLLVDDDELVRKMTCRSLEHLGCTVFAVASGLEAVALYTQKSASIDLVLLDMTMPGMNGLETLIALREVDPSVRAIVASGLDAEGVRLECAHVGMAAVLQKPYRAHELYEAILSVLHPDPS